MLEKKASQNLEDKHPLVHDKNYYDSIEDFNDLISSESPLMMFESDITIAILTVMGFTSINITYFPNSILLTGTYRDTALTFEIGDKSPEDWFSNLTRTLTDFLTKIAIEG